MGFKALPVLCSHTTLPILSTLPIISRQLRAREPKQAVCIQAVASTTHSVVLINTHHTRSLHDGQSHRCVQQQHCGTHVYCKGWSLLMINSLLS
jgi:endonuclease/exonuclease/phosphatase (EEP) superfamily protein YafD